MKWLKKLWQWSTTNSRDERFIELIHGVENIVSKILSIALIIIIIMSVFQLIVVLAKDFLSPPFGSLEKSLLDIFGLFLNILIALELLENITAYLKKHVVQVELVIVTSLIAVARKIIIFDFSKYEGFDLIALAFAILALSISYWLIRRSFPR
jgi:uncharacterized membrane protein (DUF373 family)